MLKDLFESREQFAISNKEKIIRTQFMKYVSLLFKSATAEI